MAQDNTSNANYYLQKLEKKSRNPIDPLDAGTLVNQSSADTNTVVTRDVIVIAFINSADSATYQDLDNKDPADNFDFTNITTGQTLSIVSTSAADAAAGTGIRTILVSGLDSNYNEITETITLTGLTPATSTKLFLRVNSVIMTTVGSGGEAAGDITCTGGGETWWKWLATESSLPIHMYTVPANYTLALKYLYWSSSKNGECIVRQRANSPTLPQQVSTRYIMNGNAHTAVAHMPFKIVEKMDVSFQIRKESGGGVIPMQILAVGALFSNQYAIRYFDG